MCHTLVRSVLCPVVCGKSATMSIVHQYHRGEYWIVRLQVHEATSASQSAPAAAETTTHKRRYDADIGTDTKAQGTGTFAGFSDCTFVVGM